MTAYYNEINEDAAAVLEAQIEDGVIAPGIIDTRSIKDVHPNDLKGFTQCHFFAGGGLWSVAARMAGWPDDRPIWTGSCPCQPFSSAGKGAGTDDPRHLWPDFHRLIGARRPTVVMGEQVAGKAGRSWFHGVRSDLAQGGYAGRSVDIPACAVDSPQQRNRLYWVAVADPSCNGTDARSSEIRSGRHAASIGNGDDGDVADLHRCRRDRWEKDPKRGSFERAAAERPTLRNGSWWSEAEWIVSPIDGKARRTKPGLPFLVDGLPGRVGLWSVAGNAISPILAAEVIAAFIDEYGLPQS